MNQRRTGKMKPVPEAAPETGATNHFTNIVMTGEAEKLGSKSTGKVLFEIALHDDESQLFFRIAGQTGGAGLHSKEWVSLNTLFELIESQEDRPWKSQLYKPLFKGGSANNQGFCAAICRGLGLAQKPDSSMYLHVQGEKYLERKQALLKLADQKNK